jgi:hypothetical protein
LADADAERKKLLIENKQASEKLQAFEKKFEASEAEKKKLLI